MAETSTSSPRTIRWGIIGTGAIARRFVQDLAFVPGAEIISVWGRNPATSRALAEQARAAAAPSLEALLATALDVVYIATLPDSHAAYSIAALHAGKAVLCEKPVAMNLPELDEVLSVAAKHQLLFMEAMKPPFFPVYRKLVEHLQREPIGTVSFVRSGFSIATEPAHTSWDLASGGGSLMSIGVYHAFLALEWLGDLERLQAAGRIGATGVDAFAALLTEHASGIAQLFSGLDITTPAEAILVGPMGYVALHGRWWNPERITVHYNDGRRAELHEAISGSGLNYETAHVCDLLRGRSIESAIMPHATSRRIMDLIDRARLSLRVRHDR